MSTITIRCRLTAKEDTRQHLWQLMAEKNTPLINELLKSVSQQSDFEVWCRKGGLPKSAVKQLCDALKRDPRFVGQPGRFYSSAERTVHQTYEAWLASHQSKKAELEGKKRWLKTIESDTELAVTCNASIEVICAKANEILDLISASSHPDNLAPEQPNKVKKTRQNKEDASVMGKLSKLLNATEDPLSRRAIIHLLKHGCKVSDRENDPEKPSLDLLTRQ